MTTGHPAAAPVTIQRISHLALALAVLTLLLITLGGIVRTTGAGLACPDWPLCHGKLLPLLQPLVLIEWTHRLVAGVLGLLILAQLVWALVVPALRSRLGGLAGLALGLYLSQAVLGGLTVLHLLKPSIVNLHLANALALFVVLIVIALRTAREAQGVAGPEPGASPGLFRLSLAAALAVYLQAALGGGVSSNGAGLACPDFPTCHGMWLPPLAGMVGLQVAHRIGALLTFALLVWLHLAALSGPYRARVASRLALFLAILQIAIGIVNVHSRLTISLSVAHLATAAVLLALVVVTAYSARPRRTEGDEVAVSLQDVHAA